MAATTRIRFTGTWNARLVAEAEAQLVDAGALAIQTIESNFTRAVHDVNVISSRPLDLALITEPHEVLKGDLAATPL